MRKKRERTNEVWRRSKREVLVEEKCCYEVRKWRWKEKLEKGGE